LIDGAAIDRINNCDQHQGNIKISPDYNKSTCIQGRNYRVSGFHMLTYERDVSF
jgi:hypothetical protein